ncbi:MAG: DevR family CRISPR-associated autoregulator [Nitrospiraceae bacterium]|nr:DevR family CRISPR-associated autoregulator [Nitrospiraceae bacterium]
MTEEKQTIEMSHIVGTFLVSAHGAFLNGAGIDTSGEDRTSVIPKQFSDGKYRVPYVSAQAWRHWLRDTLIEETGWQKSTLRAIKLSAKGTTSKISGELDPINYPEDDLFGYMRAEEGQGRTKKPKEESTSEGTQKGTKVKALIRASPFMSSILVSLRKFGWKGKDEGFVHLEEGTPVPYSTVFYNTNLQAIFGLDMTRSGVFRNVGDRIELREDLIKPGMESGKLKEREENIYELSDSNTSKIRAGELLHAISVLRGGAKQAAFATDVSPKVLILAGLDCGNLIFNNLFEDNPDQAASDGPIIKVDTLKEIASDYADRLVTPVYIGIRKGYLNPENETTVHALSNGDSRFVVDTPINATKTFVSEHLGYDRNKKAR